MEIGLQVETVLHLEAHLSVTGLYKTPSHLPWTKCKVTNAEMLTAGLRVIITGFQEN